MLREGSPPTMFCISHVKCQGSGVTCQVLGVTVFKKSDKAVDLVVKGSLINGASLSSFHTYWNHNMLFSLNTHESGA